MDTTKCNEFVVLSKTRNFLEASEQLNISQSSLSKHMQSLEKELGVTLLDRSTRKVSLSKSGLAFLPYAEKIARLDYEVRGALSEDTHHERKVLGIGSIPVMTPYGITKILADYERSNPGVRLRIYENDAQQLKSMMRKGDLELAFIREWDQSVESDDGDEEFDAFTYTEDKLVAVLPLTHPLASLDEIDLRMLADEDFLLLPSGSVMYSLILDVCSTAGFTPKVRYSGSRADNIIDLVSRGMGVSLLMKKPASYLDNQRVVLVDVDPTFLTYIKLYRLRGRRLTPEAQAFFDYVRRISAKK